MKKSFKTIVAGVLALVMALSVGMTGILGTWEGVSLEAKDAAYTGLEANDENWTEYDSLIYFRDSSPYSIMSDEVKGIKDAFNDHFKEVMGGDYYPLFRSRQIGFEGNHNDIDRSWLSCVDMYYPQYSKQAYELWVAAVNHYEETGEYAFDDLVHFYRDLWVLENWALLTETALTHPSTPSFYSGFIKDVRNASLNVDWANSAYESERYIANYVFNDFGREDWRGDPKPWFDEEMIWAFDNHIIKGSNSQLVPNKTCTDAEILTMLWRTVKPVNTNWDNPFENVKENDWYFFPAKWAAEEGLISGGHFDVNKPCTRAMVVTYLWKLAGSPDVAYNGDFSDVADGTDLAKAVAWAIQQGITNGTGNRKFSPDDTCTRAQIVVFLFRTYADKFYRDFDFDGDIKYWDHAL